jgi:quinol monooxygenase YgiN
MIGSFVVGKESHVDAAQRALHDSKRAPIGSPRYRKIHNAIRLTRTHLERSFSPMVNVLTVVAKVRAAKGNGDALAALLSEQATVVRNAEPGCLVYRVHRSTKDPELFLFYEMYVDDAAFDLHRKAPHLAAYRQRREKEGLTDGAAEVEIFRSFTE